MTTFASRILSVARTEFETAKRLSRFKLLRIILPLTVLVGFGLSCLILMFVAPYSPTYGAATPKYLLENIDPSFFLIFQFVALFLLFDAPHRHSRSRIQEVLDVKPVSNLELLIGRVIAISALVWLLAVVALLIPCVIGLIAAVASFDFAEPINLVSVVNLLFLDTPVTLLYWSAFIVFLSSLLRLRIAVLMVAAGLMVMWFYLTIESPYTFLPLVSPSSNDSLFVSDIVPEFVGIPTLLTRLATLLLACALIVLAATWLKRQNRQDTRTLQIVLPLVLLTGIGSYGLASGSVLGEIGQSAHWHDFHASIEDGTRVDLTNITGRVLLDGKTRLEIDLTLEFTVDSNESNRVVFLFNPGMDIRELELNGFSARHEFENGLLQVTSTSPLNSQTIHSLQIEAIGRPNPRFAYFDSEVDYINDRNVPVQSTSLFGRDGSIYNSKYIALMPGVCWYPVPGTVGGNYEAGQKGSDYFDVDLEVNLSPSSWTLIGTGETTRHETELSTYRVKTLAPVPEVGLFASLFGHMTTEVDGVNIAMYFHVSHARDLSWLQEHGPVFRSQAMNWIRQHSSRGFELPQQTLAFVDVPRRLRTVGGGWRMDSVAALPGVFLMKEHGFPRALLDVAFEHLDDGNKNSEQLRSEQIELVAQYFAWGLETDNLWSSLPKALWSDVTSAAGEYSQVLDQVALLLIAKLAGRSNQFFSIYGTSHVAHLTGVNPFVIGEFSGLVVGNETTEEWVSAPIQSLATEFGRRSSVWQYTEEFSFPELPTGNNQRDLELLLFKSNEIAKSLLLINGDARVFAWLSDIRRKFAGKTYSYRDMLTLAREHKLTIDPFLTGWLLSSSLPGYVVSRMSVDRIADDSEGHAQFKTSVTVRNLESTAGLVRLRYPTERTWDWMFPYYTESQGVLIPGNSARRINLITPYEVRVAHLLPGLSQNRGVITLRKRSSGDEELENVESLPFSENSEWIPAQEIGIIVDDLDPGFVVHQSLPSLSPYTSMGPIGWFTPPRLQIELDNGLPAMGSYYARKSEVRVPKGTWGRLTESTAYGRYRKTIASAWIRDKIRSARFTADLPETNKWTLSFHVPRGWRPGSNLDLQWKFRIFDDSQEWIREFDLGSKTPGWNIIGQFDLEQGKVNVELASASKPTHVYADAIRWTRPDEL